MVIQIYTLLSDENFETDRLAEYARGLVDFRVRP
jgi:hypothetical protein